MNRRDFFGTVAATGLSIGFIKLEPMVIEEKYFRADRVRRIIRSQPKRLYDCKVVFTTNDNKQFIVPVKTIAQPFTSIIWSFQSLIVQDDCFVIKDIKILDDEDYLIKDAELDSSWHLSAGDQLKLSYRWNYDRRILTSDAPIAEIDPLEITTKFRINKD